MVPKNRWPASTTSFEENCPLCGAGLPAGGAGAEEGGGGGFDCAAIGPAAKGTDATKARTRERVRIRASIVRSIGGLNFPQFRF